MQGSCPHPKSTMPLTPSHRPRVPESFVLPSSGGQAVGFAPLTSLGCQRHLPEECGISSQSLRGCWTNPQTPTPDQ